jgi:hypothetical protein
MLQSSKFFRCALPTDGAAADVIRNLQEQGLLGADHVLRCKDNIVTVLSEAEIALLKEAGVAVDIRAPLDCLTPNPGYLDARGIDAAWLSQRFCRPLGGCAKLGRCATGWRSGNCLRSSWRRPPASAAPASLPAAGRRSAATLPPS